MSHITHEVHHGQTSFLSEDEANKLIKKYDKNGDSVLTKDELTSLILSQASQPHGAHVEIVTKHPKEHVKVAKVEKDAVACKPEKKPAKPPAQKPPPQKPFKIKFDREQIREIFLEHDIDGDGYLTPSEITKAFACLGSMLPFHKAHFGVKLADADGDGLIDEEELEKLIDYADRVINRK